MTDGSLTDPPPTTPFLPSRHACAKVLLENKQSQEASAAHSPAGRYTAPLSTARIMSRTDSIREEPRPARWPRLGEWTAASGARGGRGTPTGMASGSRVGRMGGPTDTPTPPQLSPDSTPGQTDSRKYRDNCVPSCQCQVSQSRKKLAGQFDGNATQSREACSNSKMQFERWAAAGAEMGFGTPRAALGDGTVLGAELPCVQPPLQPLYALRIVGRARATADQRFPKKRR